MKTIYTIVTKEKGPHGPYTPTAVSFEVGKVLSKEPLFKNMKCYEDDSERIKQIHTRFIGECMKYGGVYKDIIELLNKPNVFHEYKAKEATIILYQSLEHYPIEREIFGEADEDLD